MNYFYLLFLLLVFPLVLLLRALAFKPKKQNKLIVENVDMDFDKAISRFSGMIKIPTVSHADVSLEDPSVFKKFQDYLNDAYPLVTKTCPRRILGPKGLLYHWKGKSSEKASVFMAHYDVVPVNREGWSQDPFGAEIIDNVLWGRGTLDTKCTLCGVMEAAEYLLSKGFIPEHDIYLSFSGDEEPHGPSCPAIVEELKKENINVEFVLDEGGAVVEGVFPGIKERFAVIGIGEKGQMDVELSMESKGGHASTPPKHTIVGKLAQAVCNIENNPLPMHVTPPVSAMFDVLGRHAGLGMRLVFANLKVFYPLFNMLTKKTGGELNAMLRTTTAVTKMAGSDAFNVIPPKASIGINIRYLAEDGRENIISHFKRVIKNEDVKIEVKYDEEPSRYSKIDSPEFELLSDAIRQTWEKTLVTPYLMMACSDSRHYSKISDKVYRFSAMHLTKEERGLIHGNDERIRLDEFKRTLAFFVRIMNKF